MGEQTGACGKSVSCEDASDWQGKRMGGDRHACQTTEPGPILVQAQAFPPVTLFICSMFR